MEQVERETARGAGVRRWLPVVALAAAAVLAYSLGLHRYLTFRSLSEHREWLLLEVNELGIVAPIAFVAIYATVAALSIPGAAVMTLTGGFLFGTVLGTLYNLSGATIGATLIFLIARSAFGGILQRRAGPFLKKVEADFRRDAVSYLLVLRLVPLFPFWLVNLVPALFGMSLGTYVVCSFFGMMPGALVYTSVGAGLGMILDRGETPDLGIIFDPRILLPLLGLALLALAPVLYKWWKRRR
jgi:uncharacterized membrane protein YdjX (TVP38/TMEM64 family)